MTLDLWLARLILWWHHTRYRHTPKPIAHHDTVRGYNVHWATCKTCGRRL